MASLEPNSLAIGVNCRGYASPYGLPMAGYLTPFGCPYQMAAATPQTSAFAD
ncbi:hypothetical protein BH09VER1_BH09VER1_45970 [soil metagenome]